MSNFAVLVMLHQIIFTFLTLYQTYTYIHMYNLNRLLYYFICGRGFNDKFAFTFTLEFGFKKVKSFWKFIVIHE